MASLGQELRRERELRGISLQEIADATRISMRFLQAIEEDQLDRIPGEFFVRAILRSYAKSIGIDENQVLNKYREMLSFQEQRQDREDRERTPRRRLSPAISRKRTRIGAAAIGAVVLGLTLIYVFSRSPGKEMSTLQETGLPNSVPVVLPEPPPAAVEETRGLHLRVDFTEETWLQIQADGESFYDGIKAMGESLEVMAEQEVLLDVGNAGGFDLTINGQKARPLGPRGAVRKDIRITPENYRDFLAPEGPENS